MDTTWVLAADATRARLFEMDGPGPLREVQDFFNPEGRAHARDLQSDANGRYFGKGERSQGHTAPPREDPVEHDVDLFAGELADFLDKARTQHRYARLKLVAPPKFLGKLRQRLGKEVEKMLAGTINKDVSRDDAAAIAELVR